MLLEGRETVETEPTYGVLIDGVLSGLADENDAKNPLTIERAKYFNRRFKKMIRLTQEVIEAFITRLAGLR